MFRDRLYGPSSCLVFLAGLSSHAEFLELRGSRNLLNERKRALDVFKAAISVGLLGLKVSAE